MTSLVTSAYRSQCSIMPKLFEEGNFAEAVLDKDRAELSETFKLFDRDGDGHLTMKELGDAMRAMGLHPTEKEIQDIVHPYGELGSGLTDFDEFMSIMATRLLIPEPEGQLLEAFRVFDKEGTGFISTEKLREIVTTMGECLTKAEVEEMLQDADAANVGQVKYEDFIQLLIQQ